MKEQLSFRLYKQKEPNVGTESMNHLKSQGEEKVANNLKTKIRVVGYGKTQTTDKYLPSMLWLKEKF